MKKFLLFLTAAVLAATVVDAQKLIQKNGDERFGKKLKTTDSTFTSIDSIIVNTNEAGVVEAKVVGLDTTNNKAVTGYIVVRYNSAAGTITLGTPQALSTITTDSGLSPATFQVTSSGSKIYLQVKGKLGVPVHWYSSIVRNSIYKSR